MVRCFAVVAGALLAGCAGARSAVDPLQAQPLSIPLWPMTAAASRPSQPTAVEPAGSYPRITKVTRIVAQQTQTFEVDGINFGTNEPYFGDSQYFWIYDLTQNWRAGCGEPDPCGTTLNVTSWTDKQIVVAGFGGSYSQTPLEKGDRLLILVWNAQTGKGPATRARTVK